MLRPGLLVLPVRVPLVTSVPNRRPPSGWSMPSRRPGWNVRWELPTSCRLLSSPRGGDCRTGRDAAFLSPLSITQLSTGQTFPRRVAKSWRIFLKDGIRNLGRFAALSRTDVASVRGGCGDSASHCAASRCGGPSEASRGRNSMRCCTAIHQSNVSGAAFCRQNIGR